VEGGGLQDEHVGEEQEAGTTGQSTIIFKVLLSHQFRVWVMGLTGVPRL
jgi:hypothetical protein